MWEGQLNLELGRVYCLSVAFYLNQLNVLVLIHPFTFPKNRIILRLCAFCSNYFLLILENVAYISLPRKPSDSLHVLNNLTVWCNCIQFLFYWTLHDFTCFTSYIEIPILFVSSQHLTNTEAKIEVVCTFKYLPNW